MRIERLDWIPGAGWRRRGDSLAHASLVLYFGLQSAMAGGAMQEALRAMFPGAHVLGCSSVLPIANDELIEVEATAVALSFDATRLSIAFAECHDAIGSAAAGVSIARQLRADDLAGIFLLSDGTTLNGSALVSALRDEIGHGVPVTGGLASGGKGPDARPQDRPLVGIDDLAPRAGMVAAIGFYGTAIRFGTGCAGGWDAFGPYRRVTRAEGNTVMELDGRPALDLYERYLGEEAAFLPQSALSYPLSLRDPLQPGREVMRAVLGIDRTRRSLRFAGDIPEGAVVQLMHGAVWRLTRAAADAGVQAGARVADAAGDRLAILVSCVGRQAKLGQRAADEVEAVAGALPPHANIVGFYSNGEIAPQGPERSCELHNQTMTVTCLAET